MSTPEREGNPPAIQDRENTLTGAPNSHPQGEEIIDVISGVQSQLEALRKAHAERQKALAALAAQRQQIEEGQRALERRRQEIESARGELDTGSERLKALERELLARTGQLDEREARIEQAASHVAQYEKSLATRTQQLEEEAQQAARLRAELEEVRKVSVERRDQVEALEKRIAELEKGDPGADERLARSTAKIEALSTRVQDAEGGLAARDKRIAELQAALREASQASPESEKEKTELRRLRAHIVEIDRKAKQSEERAAALQSELEARAKALAEARAAMAEAGKTAQALEAANKALKERKGEIEELRQKLEQTEAEAAENLKKGKGVKLEAIRQENEQLLERVHELEQGGGGDEALQREVESLRAELERTRHAEAERSGIPVETALRRRRLKRQKALLREQTLKLRRASEAIRERHEQCERVLAKRAQLAEAHQAIAEKQAQLANVKAKSGALWLTLGLVTMTAMLAGLSWLISGQVAPGEYAARAVIVADGGSRELTPEQLGSWQVYHEDLTHDPRLLENVADRLERRGFRDLKDLPALGRLITDQLDTQSPSPGRLEFELRDKGAGRVQRVLDTYVVALASVANQNRARRADGATTRIDVASEVIPDPLDNTRVMTAGGIFGGSMFMTLVVGVGAWRRMARAKERFERDSRVGVLEDDSQWVVPGDA
ncbi:MAG: hypothetical protein R3B57_03890 [Phycisphaerales bacterium]